MKTFLSNGILKKKIKKNQEKKIKDFFVSLVIMSLINWPYFHFIEVTISLTISLAINKAILRRK